MQGSDAEGVCVCLARNLLWEAVLWWRRRSRTSVWWPRTKGGTAPYAQRRADMADLEEGILWRVLLVRRSGPWSQRRRAIHARERGYKAKARQVLRRHQDRREMAARAARGACDAPPDEDGRTQLWTGLFGGRIHCKCTYCKYSGVSCIITPLTSPVRLQ